MSELRWVWKPDEELTYEQMENIYGNTEERKAYSNYKNSVQGISEDHEQETEKSTS
jgi:hypothetical protein